MPKKAEKALKSGCRKKKMSAKRCNAYVYGTLRRMGWKPKREK